MKVVRLSTLSTGRLYLRERFLLLIFVRDWVVVWPAGRPDHDQNQCYHHAPTVKPEASTAIVELLMMGVRVPETC
jgi:hypothetical protein